MVAESMEGTVQKIGPHGQRSTPQFQNWARRARIAKAMDIGSLAAAKADNPSLFTIYRYPLADSEKDSCTPSRLASLTLNKIAEAGFKPDAIEYKNEWRCYCWDDAARHIDELEAFCQIAHSYGQRVCGGNWSFGTPEPDDVRYWASRGFGGCDYLGIHEYSNRIVGAHDVWTILRHRLIHEWTAGNHPPILVTECGIDNLNDLGDGWIRQGMSPQEYVTFLQEYNTEICQDAYVLGAVVFVSGSYPDMAGFETDGISDQYIVPLYTGNEPIIQPPTQPPTGGDPVAYEWQLAFADFAAAHPEVGKAVSPIAYVKPVNPEGKQMIWQFGEGGKLEYDEASGRVYFFKAASKS